MWSRQFREESGWPARTEKLAKWTPDYIMRVHTLLGATDIEELTQLREQRRTLIKLYRLP
jgi:hypothetical protein